MYPDDKRIAIYGNYQCEVNAISVPQLFAFYEEAGFLYPAKRDLLNRHRAAIIANWEKALSSPDDLMFVISTAEARSERSGAGCATITSWRSCRRGWFTQHLVCLGNPLGSRKVMLSTSAARTDASDDESHQLWFRPENKYPRRIFGTMVEAVGRTNSSLLTSAYFALPRSLDSSLLSHEREVNIMALDDAQQGAFGALVEQAKGSVYFNAEDLKTDPTLAAVDELYGKVGLRRFRRVALAYLEGRDEPVAAAISYRGPLGLNFSFLENRIDLLVTPELPLSSVVQTLLPLLHQSLGIYADFELDWVPLIAPQALEGAIQTLGVRFIRTYSQGIWLRQGFWDWFRHVDSFYARVSDRKSTQKIGARP